MMVIVIVTKIVMQVVAVVTKKANKEVTKVAIMEVIRKVVVIDVVIFDVSGFSGNALLGIIMNLTFIEGVCQC